MHIGFFKFKMHLIVINDNASIDARKTCSLTTIMVPNCLQLYDYQHEALHFMQEVPSLDLGQDNDYSWLDFSVVFLTSLGNFKGSPQLDHDYCISNPFQFIIHQSPYKL